MSVFRAFAALFQGFRLCLFQSDVRRLARWPFLVGLLCYPLTLFAAYYSHGWLLHLLISDPQSWWQHILYGLAWLMVTGLLMIFSFAITLAMVMIFAGVFQTGIAAQVLRLQNVALPEEGQGLSATTQEVLRTVAVETKKLLWLLPLMLVALLLGFIPLLTPIALLLTAWLLAYQFLDIPLDCLRLSVRKRLWFGISHPLTFVIFGFCLSICWAVPFLGIVLSPVAVAGAAWLVADNSELRALVSAQSETSQTEVR